jgi:hypothetical protein
MILDCDFAPYANNFEGYEQYLVSVMSSGAIQAGYGVRIYRTFAGLRVIACHGTVGIDQGIRFMLHIPADSDYVLACRRSGVYSGRLSPKPFRIGSSPHHRWDYTSLPTTEQDSWLRAYEAHSADYATCHYKVSAPQNAPITPDLREFFELHDSKTRALTDLPLA